MVFSIRFMIRREPVLKSATAINHQKRLSSLFIENCVEIESISQCRQFSFFTFLLFLRLFSFSKKMSQLADGCDGDHQMPIDGQRFGSFGPDQVTPEWGRWWLVFHRNNRWNSAKNPPTVPAVGLHLLLYVELLRRMYQQPFYKITHTHTHKHTHTHTHTLLPQLQAMSKNLTSETNSFRPID